MSLNDPQWGRGGGSGNNNNDDGEREQPRKPQRPGNDGPPDLEELWREFNRRLNGMFGKKGGRRGNGSGGGGFGNLNPSPRGTGIGLAALLAVLGVIWLASGFYIVPEGQVGVVTTFGRYEETTRPGFRWRMPWPVQRNELVDILSIQKVEVGTRGRPDRLKEALMLTDDENIVVIQFEAQFRIKDDGARDFLFNHRDPRAAVMQSAESAMREVLGRRKMDSVLYESRAEIATEVRERMQQMMDLYGTGVLMTAVAINNAQPPEQVQAAFDDAVKAGQDRERQINDGQAYANEVVPRARGAASRLLQEAEGYRTRVVQTAEGDASRFKQILAEYQKAPAVTRDRMYVDAMQQIFGSVTKVYVDSRNNNQLLYLPFDKLMQQASQEAMAPRTPAVVTPPAEVTPPVTETRTRDSLRSRDREAR